VDSPDVKVRSYDDHEESVYSVAWSAADPFVFVSVSYDGRVVLNHVPSTEKYKVLL
jgi:EARP and GARP complex-interacting protein 1